MDTKELQDIPTKYPKLFKKPVNIASHEGWYDLIDELSKKLEKLVSKHNLDVYVLDIKEKFGTLRFYMSSSTPEMDELIEEAEAKSAYICELCGSPGRIHSHFRWLFTRCDNHKDL